MTQKILVVDDDQFIRELYETVLKNAGYEVDLAVNGEEGLVKLQSGGYALTLLDMRMPGLDGVGLLDGLQKTTVAVPNGPIILLTNAGPDEKAQEGLQKGASAYLVKADMTPDQLLENIRKFLTPQT